MLNFVEVFLQPLFSKGTYQTSSFSTPVVFNQLKVDDLGLKCIYTSSL
jgi:hypothetical protein